MKKVTVTSVFRHQFCLATVVQLLIITQRCKNTIYWYKWVYKPHEFYVGKLAPPNEEVMVIIVMETDCFTASYICSCILKPELWMPKRHHKRQTVCYSWV